MWKAVFVAGQLIVSGLSMTRSESVAAASAAPRLSVPAGFEITLFATEVPNARQLAVASDDLIFAGSREEGKVYAIVDRNHDFSADEVITVAESLHMPSGVALHDGALYVGAVERILRYDHIASTFREHPRPTVLPIQLPSDDAHGWKYLGFGPDGMLYIPVGAPCNICRPDAPYVSILRMAPTGNEFSVFARGIRNSVGFTWHPVTHDLWFTDNGRDWLGDDSPSCELNRATRAGQHFGYPFIHGGDTPDPELSDGHPPADFVAPAAKLGAHVAPLGLMFYRGKQFSMEYRGNLLIAEHGSWNRSRKVGYRVVRVVLNDHSEVVQTEPFITGWLQGAGSEWAPS